MTVFVKTHTFWEKPYTYMKIQAFLSPLIYHLSVQFTGALNFVFQHFWPLVYMYPVYM